MISKVRFTFLASGALSLAYFVSPSLYTKPLAIWALSAIAYTAKSKYGFSIATGLLFSSAGDILLRLDDTTHPDQGLFIFGLLAFLVAHLLYIRAFIQSHLDYKHATALMVPVAAFYFTINTILLPNMESGLVIPVLIYGLAISTMALLAILRFLSDSTCGTLSRYCSLIGSLVFVISDSILAINKFARPIPDAHFFVMITYYFGQTYLAASAISPRRAKKV
jgi:uncharacterized membrane protein YhhN